MTRSTRGYHTAQLQRALRDWLWMANAKRVVLLHNKAIRTQGEQMRELGLFDTVGWKCYEKTNDLCDYLSSLNSFRPLRIPDKKKGNARPFFVVWPSERTESEIRLLSRIKKQARISAI